MAITRTINFNRNKKLNRSLLGNLSVLTVLLMVAAFMMVPFIYAVVQAFKPMEEIFAYPPRFFVINPTLLNFTQMWRLSNSLWIPFSRYLFNTVFVTGTGIILSICVSTMAAFPLAKYDFPGNRAISRLITMALLFTGPVVALPQYIIVAKLGIFDTFWAVILPAAAAPLNLFLMRNFMTQIPDAVIKAATIDGAGIFKVFTNISLPLVRPALLTSMILTFQSMWNATGGSYIISEDMKLLPAMMGEMLAGGIARTGTSAAASLLLIIPSLVIFILLQTKIVETMAFSGIKE